MTQALRNKIVEGELLGVTLSDQRNFIVDRYKTDYTEYGVNYGTTPSVQTISNPFVTTRKRGFYREIDGYDNTNYASLKAEGVILPPTKYDNIEVFTDFSSQLNLAFTKGGYFGSYATFDDKIEVKSDDDYYDVSYDSILSRIFDEINIMKEYVDSYNFGPLEQRAAAKIYTTGFDALTNGSQFRQIVRLFTKIRKRIWTLLSSGKLYNLWLEGRYGWRLLIYDILDLEETIINFDSKRSRYTEKVYEKLSLDSTITHPEMLTLALPPNVTDSISNIIYGYRPITSVKSDLSLNGCVTADIFPAKFRLSPLDTAWEIIPYSFVLDWFVGVGTWLSSLGLRAAGSDYVVSDGILARISINTTVGETAVLNSASWEPYTDDEKIGTGIDFHGQVDVVIKQRRPSALSSIPQISNQLSSLKVLDLSALIAQNARRR